jgi:hypothetical protein
MQRIETVDELFQGGDPATGTKGTVVPPKWLNDLQEEVAQAIEALGGALDPGDNAQLAALLISSFANVAGSAGQVFKAAPGVANDEVVTKGQISSFANVAGDAGQVFKAAPGVANDDVVTKGQAATEGGTGLIELATAGEVQAGTDTGRAVTPAGLASFASSFSGQGYAQLPGGLMLQWGENNAVLAGNPVSFPIAFPNSCLCVIASGDVDDIYSYGTGGFTPTGFVFYTTAAPGFFVTSRWLAIGY